MKATRVYKNLRTQKYGFTVHNGTYSGTFWFTKKKDATNARRVFIRDGLQALKAYLA